jgi:hypothetical protein
METAVPLRSRTAAAVTTALLALLTGCGGEGAAEPGEGSTVVMEDDLVEGFVQQVGEMGIVEWRSQMLTKAPQHGGKRIFELTGRYSPSTGYSEVSMDSAIDGVKQQVDYLVVAGRTYFNSEDWGPAASDCWVDITGDVARTWGLPTQLDPTWPVTAARAVRLQGEGARVGIPSADVVRGMPRGLFPAVPPALKGIEAGAEIIPHGPLLEVGVDVAQMWADIPEDQRASVDPHRAGWWAMTLQEARDGSAVQPPAHVFDPAVTAPRRCMKG